LLEKKKKKTTYLPSISRCYLGSLDNFSSAIRRIA